MFLEKNDYHVQLPKEYFKNWIVNGDYYSPEIFVYLFRDYTLAKNIKFTKHEIMDNFN
jgi:hypothetical protein